MMNCEEKDLIESYGFSEVILVLFSNFNGVD